MDARILIVDDESKIAGLVEVYLESEGRAVFKRGTSIEALAMVRTQALDLAALDVILPDISGFTLCGEIHKEHHSLVLMLTARAEDMDKITSFTINTDDYVTKPFNPSELTVRVKAQLRRYTRYNEAGKVSDCRDIIGLNGLVISQATHKRTLYDRGLGPTPIEFDILWILCENRGQAIFTEWSFENVWGEKYLDCDNTAMAHIRRLREKMGESPRNPRFIKTIWGVGYRID